MSEHSDCLYFLPYLIKMNLMNLDNTEVALTFIYVRRESPDEDLSGEPLAVVAAVDGAVVDPSAAAARRRPPSPRAAAAAASLEHGAGLSRVAAKFIHSS